MTCRERFVNFVRHGGSAPYVSLQIGAGAGFDTKLAGKEWVSETTLDDTIAAYRKVGCDALINIGLPDFGRFVPELAWKSESQIEADARTYQSWLDTPHGELRWELRELPRQGSTPTHYPMTFGDTFDRVYWYIEQFHKASSYAAEALGPHLEPLHPEWPVSVQWSIQPFEMFCFATVPDVVMYAMLENEAYHRLCRDIRDVNIAMCQAVIAAGADFVFLGGPGREMMSPRLYEEFIVPDSQAITRAVHEAGGLIYSHICSPIEPFLSKGYYGQMGIDLFETLSPPPVGNVTSLAEARQHLPESVCTRGNIGLDVLLRGNTDEIRATTQAIIDATRGTRHMVAASDYLFYDISFESVKTVVDTVRAAGGH